MAYENAIRILQNSNAKIAESAEGLYDENFVILFWDEVEARHLNECVRYLNEAAAKIISGPSQFYDVLFSDDLFHLHAHYKEDASSKSKSQRIYRIMMRNAVAYTEDNWSLTTTKWKLHRAETFTHGPTGNITLTLPNVQPAAALAFEEQTLAETYTDEIYMLTGVRLDGTWHSIKRVAEEDPATGLYQVYWFLSQYNNTNLYFKYQSGEHITKGHYYKWEATDETLDALLSKTVFDNDTGEEVGDPGDLYTSGTSISDISSSGWAFDSWDTTYGRAIFYSVTKPDIALVWMQNPLTVGKWVFFNTSTFSILYENTAQTRTPPLTGWVTVDGVGTLSSLSWMGYHTNVAVLVDPVIGRTVINRSVHRDNEDRMLDISIDIIWVKGESEAVSLNRRTTFTGININPDLTSGDPRCITANGTLLHWIDFKAYVADFGGSFSVKENEDGTIDYNAVLVNDATESITLTVERTVAVRHTKIKMFAYTEAEMITVLNSILIEPTGSIVE